MIATNLRKECHRASRRLTSLRARHRTHTAALRAAARRAAESPAALVGVAATGFATHRVFARSASGTARSRRLLPGTLLLARVVRRWLTV